MSAATSQSAMRKVLAVASVVFSLQGCISGEASMAYSGRLPDAYLQQNTCTAKLAEMDGFVLATSEVDSGGFHIDIVGSGTKRKLLISFKCLDEHGNEVAKGGKQVDSRRLADGVLDVGELR